MDTLAKKWKVLKKTLKDSQQPGKGPCKGQKAEKKDQRVKQLVTHIVACRKSRDDFTKPTSLKALKRRRSKDNQKAKKRLEWRSNKQQEGRPQRRKGKGDPSGGVGDAASAEGQGQPSTLEELTALRAKERAAAAAAAMAAKALSRPRVAVKAATGASVSPKSKNAAQQAGCSHPQRTVKVERLDPWIRSGDLKRFFTLNCGVVEKLYVGRAPSGPNWAYVTFVSEVDASKALAFDGKKASEEMVNPFRIIPAPSDPKRNPTTTPLPEIDDTKQVVLGELVPTPEAAARDEPLAKFLEEQKRRKRAKKRGLDPDRPVDFVPLKKSRFLRRNAAQVDGLETPQYLTTLNSGTFRLLNDMFCLSTSADARKFFDTTPEMFHKYHEGYREQVKKWPVNPLNIIIEDLKKFKNGYPSVKESKKENEKDDDIPQDTVGAEFGGIPKHWRICDLGCGDAQLALEMSENTVFSFDLRAANERVTVADIAHVPLDSYSCEVAVLCLAMLGTNYVDFLLEANRVLVNRGLLKVVEICSRVPIPEMFQQLMKPLGFWCLRTEKINDFFFIFDFSKHSEPQPDWRKRVQALNPLEVVKPFKYKKR